MTIYTGIKYAMIESDPRRILGNFIRAHREGLPPPKTVGRRRTPGLRREELADAARVSVTWITWLEQGRDVAASASALTRLAEALQLTSAERASLFDLAGKRDPAGPTEPQVDLLPELLTLPSRPICLIAPGLPERGMPRQPSCSSAGWMKKQPSAICFNSSSSIRARSY